MVGSSEELLTENSSSMWNVSGRRTIRSVIAAERLPALPVKNSSPGRKRWGRGHTVKVCPVSSRLSLTLRYIFILSLMIMYSLHSAAVCTILCRLNKDGRNLRRTPERGEPFWRGRRTWDYKFRQRFYNPNIFWRNLKKILHFYSRENSPSIFWLSNFWCCLYWEHMSYCYYCFKTYKNRVSKPIDWKQK